MAKTVNKLTALKVAKLKKPGFYPDGNGLYLQVSPTLSKSWVFRYKLEGRSRKQGLGSCLDVSLNAARSKAGNSRELKRAGIDPIDHKRKLIAQQRLDAAKGVTFQQCAMQYIESHAPGWKNPKYAQQWHSSLKTYAFPVIGDIAIQAVDVGLVLAVLEPIWTTKTETASRVRQRIEMICDWAKAREYRSGENPARWRGHMDKLLPKPSKLWKIKHFAALHYSELPEFFQWLMSQDSQAARALQITILTATRPSEGRGIVTDEIQGDVWTIPAERMKAGRDHRIPLSGAVLEVLKACKPFQRDVRVFPGRATARVINETTVNNLLKVYREGLTVHGFRSSFRDWCAEMTAYPREVAEAALAHTLRDATEAAYQRGDLLKKRARLMNEWARYCTTSTKKAKVSPINKVLKNQV